MRDPQIRPKGWSSNESDRRDVKIGHWNSDWFDRTRAGVEFRPESRSVEGSDYNLHYVDVEASAAAELNFGSRSDEVSGSRPGGSRRLRMPTGVERLRGALVAAGVGDAFGQAWQDGELTEFPWYSGGAVDIEEDKLIDFVPVGQMESTWVTQLMGFAAEGFVRALGGRRVGGEADPVKTVQHGYQRWLYYAKRDVLAADDVNEWPVYGGVFARDAGRFDTPDGLVAEEFLFRGDYRTGYTLNSAVVDALLAFAGTGDYSSVVAPRSDARGADVLVRAALAAVWSEDVEETFDLAVAVAALTHTHPDDYIPAGALAVILHQQIREVPFMDCLYAAWMEAKKWPGNEKTLGLIDNAVNLARTEWAPMQTDKLRPYFPAGGADGAEGLGIAIYSALCSDYVREAMLLAMNYGLHRCEVGAAAGLLIGAEYGVQAVPKVFRDAVEATDTLDTLALELGTELRDVLNKGEWQRRYPPT